MLYFLRQTFNKHKWHTIVFGLNSFLPAKALSTFDQYRFSCDSFIMLPPLTLTSFKTRHITLEYGRFLKMGLLALYQETTIFIVSKFEYAQCVGIRPVKLKPISRGISSEWYAIFVSSNFFSLKLASVIICMSICVTMSKKCIQMQTSMKNVVLSDLFQCKQEMVFF